MKFIYKSFKCKNTAFGQETFNLFDKAVKISKKTKSGENYFQTHQTHYDIINIFIIYFLIIFLIIIFF